MKTIIGNNAFVDLGIAIIFHINVATTRTRYAFGIDRKNVGGIRTEPGYRLHCVVTRATEIKAERAVELRQKCALTVHCLSKLRYGRSQNHHFHQRRSTVLKHPDMVKYPMIDHNPSLDITPRTWMLPRLLLSESSL